MRGGSSHTFSHAVLTSLHSSEVHAFKFREMVIHLVYTLYLSAGSIAPTVVRPKGHYARPPHPPPDPPIPEACAMGQESRLPMFMPHGLCHAEQRHSYPDRLVRSRSSDIVTASRRPTSDPSWNRRPGTEERDVTVGAPGSFPVGPSSSPSKDSLKGEVRALLGAGQAIASGVARYQWTSSEIQAGGGDHFCVVFQSALHQEFESLLIPVSLYSNVIQYPKCSVYIAHF